MFFFFKMVINKNEYKYVIYFFLRGLFSVNVIIYLKKDVVKENIMVKNFSRQISWIFVSVVEELNLELLRVFLVSSGMVFVNMIIGLKVDCVYFFGMLFCQ